MKLTDYKSICTEPHFRKIKIKKQDDKYLLSIHTNTVKEYLLSEESINDLKESATDYFYKRLVDIHTVQDVIGFLEKRRINYNIKVNYLKVDRYNYKLDTLLYRINFDDVSIDIKENVRFHSPKTYTYNYLVKKFNRYDFNSTNISIKNSDNGKVVYINSRQ